MGAPYFIRYDDVCYFSAYVRGEGSVKNTQFSLHDNRATIMKPEQNAEYISKIRMRLCDDSLARKVTLTCSGRSSVVKWTFFC